MERFLFLRKRRLRRRAPSGSEEEKKKTRKKKEEKSERVAVADDEDDEIEGEKNSQNRCDLAGELPLSSRAACSLSVPLSTEKGLEGALGCELEQDEGPRAGTRPKGGGVLPVKERSKRAKKIFLLACLLALPFSRKNRSREENRRLSARRLRTASAQGTLTLCAGRERDTREADATADIVARRREERGGELIEERG